MAISKSNGAVAETSAVETKKTLVTPSQPSEPTAGKYVSADDAKSQRILRQGVYQAVLQSPGLSVIAYTTPEEYVKLVEKIAEKVIDLVQK